ncbi:MAG: sensor histidine kinase [Myxococcales bacterium]
MESADSGSEGEHRARDLDGTALSGWAALAVLVGTTTLVAGWLFGMPALREPLSRTMKVNTAVALVLFAVALLFARRETAMRVAAMRVVAICGAVIGFVTVVEYAAGIELRIDELLAMDSRNEESMAHPGRMSPITGTALSVLGLALALFPSRGRVARAAAGVLALIVALISLVALLGYLYGASSLYRVGPAIRISQYSAAAMLVLSGSALSRFPQGTFAEIFVRPSAGGVVMRRLFFPVLFIPTLLGLLRLVGQRQRLVDPSVGTASQAVAAILGFGAIAWYLARVVDRMDATQSRALEENRRLAKTAQTALKLRDDFIGMAAHELRTPLTSLRLQMQLWQKGVDAEKGKDFSRLVQRQADRLMRLVESMLDGASLASGQMSLELRPVELAGVVREAISRVSPQLTAAGMAVETRLEARVDVVGDPLRLAQLVDTLLGNAVKYGAGKPITVEVCQPDGAAKIVVRDQGIGIHDRDQTRIFDAFERAVPATSYPGLGLGLYLARQIAEAHGGRIDVQSGVDSGTIFTVSLPSA